VYLQLSNDVRAHVHRKLDRAAQVQREDVLEVQIREQCLRLRRAFRLNPLEAASSF